MPMSENRLTEKVQAAVRAAVRDAGARSLLVACSGGGDSVCLVHAAAMVARQENVPVALGFFLHRVPSDDDQMIERVRVLAASLGVPFLWRERDEHATATDEATLRMARYAALAEMAAECGADAVLTGHTMDDQAETVLLRLLRGSGIDGLAGMAAVTTLPVNEATPVQLLRPLLGLPRSNTYWYCIGNDLVYRTDPSNADTKYARNWVRHALLPLLGEQFGSVHEILARTASLVRDDAAFLQSLADAALARMQSDDTEGGDDRVTRLAPALFAAEPIVIQRRIIRILLVRYGWNSRADEVQVVVNHLIAPTTRMLAIADVLFWPAYGELYVGRKRDTVAAVRRQAWHHNPLLRLPESLPVDDEFTFPPDVIASGTGATLHLSPWTDDAPVPVGAVPVRLPEGAPLALRNRQAGDRFRPPGAPGSRKVQDYLTERGVPAPLRDEVVLLVAGDEIAAIIGYDVAARFHASAEDATHLYHVERAAPERAE